MANPGPAKRRVEKKLAPKTLANILNPDEEMPSGTENPKRRLAKGNATARITVRRKTPQNYISRKAKRNRRETMKEAIETIFKNHGENINTIIEESTDITGIKKAARMLYTTKFTGWYSKEGTIQHNESHLKLDNKHWTLNEGKVSLTNGQKLDYDWLYQLSTINEDTNTEFNNVNPKELASSMRVTSKILDTLDSARAKEYLINYYKGKGKDTTKLEEILKEKEIIYKVNDVNIKSDNTIQIEISVRFSEDGTEKGHRTEVITINIGPELKYR